MLCDEYRFGFNGMEKDPEITGQEGSHYTAAFWEYDTRIARRWNLDPKPNPAISQYATFANNPILFSDPLGDTLNIGQNKQSRADILSLALPMNQDIIKIAEDGNVTLDYGDMSVEDKLDMLKTDEGFSLINDLTSSEKKYYYEAAETRTINNEGIESTWFAAKDNSAILNMSVNGVNSIGNNRYTSYYGNDGEVIISELAKWSETNNNGKSVLKNRASITFHELDECYLRTEFNMPYNPYYSSIGAHDGAVLRENQWWGKSNTPGVVNHGAYHPHSNWTLKKLAIKYYPNMYQK